ncbi:DUF424 family protein [Candidatus Woesearchaeota archaeon]|nr:DUF424 family protein [Candidatus Woesearchaeota archaeon]
MYCKSHQQGTQVLLAVCDEDLLGKTFTNKNGLKLVVSPHFYKGERLTPEQATEKLKIAQNANLAGEESVSLALSLHLLDPKNILYFGDAPHALIVHL